VTNEKIGDLIGLSYSAVSRLRRGERLPSIDVMVAIELHFDWSVADQVKVRTSQGPNGYAWSLNSKLDEYFAKAV
jgi:transcriptional regulator with XRE-family HTH domain